jgi:hypothetical protein
MDDTSFELHLVAQLAATLAEERGWPVGVTRDPGDGEWPILYIETPAGQVSWLLPENHLVREWPEWPDGWDGHGLEEKLRRLATTVQEPVAV